MLTHADREDAERTFGRTLGPLQAFGADDDRTTSIHRARGACRSTLGALRRAEALDDDLDLRGLFRRLPPVSGIEARKGPKPNDSRSPIFSPIFTISVSMTHEMLRGLTPSGLCHNRARTGQE